MPTISVYLNDAAYEFLTLIAKPNNPSSLGKAIIEEWIEKENIWAFREEKVGDPSITIKVGGNND